MAKNICHTSLLCSKMVCIDLEFANNLNFPIIKGWSLLSISSNGSGIFADFAGVAGESVLVRHSVNASKTSVSLSEVGVPGIGVSLAVSNALSCSISALAASKSACKVAVVLLVVLEGPVQLELAPLQAPGMLPCSWFWVSG